MSRLGIVFAVVLFAGRAAADDKPWAAGVSEPEQAAALAIYREANSEFEESRYPQALAKYREALVHWDHPAIRFNIAVALINLDQPLEAYAHLEAAMKFGAAPLGADAYAQAVTYKKLLDGQLTHLRVKCDSDAADVTLDGKPLLRCKGIASRLLLPGEHQIVATKPGYATETTSLVLVPGKEMVHVINLAPLATKLVRRWPANRPWIFVGAGAGALAVGGVLELLSYNNYKNYDDAFASSCVAGCGGTALPARPSTSLRTQARVENIAGVSLLVVGGAAAVAGLVGVYLNIPRSVLEHSPTITPTPGGATVSSRWTF